MTAGPADPPGTVPPAAVQELLDRAVLRTLIENYAAFADAGEPERLAGLFVPDGTLVVALTPGTPEPTAVRRGREEISAAIASLSRYSGTCHVVANSTLELHGDDAHGVTMCVAHHFEGLQGQRRDRVLYIRYTDRFTRFSGTWRFDAREVRVIAVENRPLQID